VDITARNISRNHTFQARIYIYSFKGLFNAKICMPTKISLFCLLTYCKWLFVVAARRFHGILEKLGSFCGQRESYTAKEKMMMLMPDETLWESLLQVANCIVMQVFNVGCHLQSNHLWRLFSTFILYLV